MIALAIGVAAAGAAVILQWQLSLFTPIEECALDLRVEAAARPQQKARILHVDIDAESMEDSRLGPWPWSRDVHGGLVDLLSSMGAKAIVFDVEFVDVQAPYIPAERMPAAREAIEALRSGEGTGAGDRERLRRELEDALIDPDAAFGEAVRRSGVVYFPIGFRDMSTSKFDSALLERSVFAMKEKPEYLEDQLVARVPAAVVSRHAVALGCTDGIDRRTPLLHSFNGDAYPQLGLRLGLDFLYGGPGNYSIESEPGRLRIVPSVDRPFEVDVNAAGECLMNRTEDFEHVSAVALHSIVSTCVVIDEEMAILTHYADLMKIPKEELPRPDVRNRAILMAAGHWKWQVDFVKELNKKYKEAGADVDPLVQTLPDRVKRILDKLHPKRNRERLQLLERVRDRVVFIGFDAAPQADLMTMVIERRFARHAPFVVEVILVVVLALGSILLSATWPLLRNSVVMLVAAGGFVGIAVIAYSSSLYVVPVALPVVVLLLPYLLITGYRSATEERIKNRIRRRFEGRVSPETLRALVDDPGLVPGEGRRRKVTLLHANLRVPTSGRPEDIVNIVAGNRAAVQDAIRKHGGFVDAGGVLGIFGLAGQAPEGAIGACRAAIASPEKIGIATGTVLLGTFGDLYTAAGEAVDVASVLSGSNEKMGTSILLDEETQKLISDDSLQLRSLGEKALEGLEKPISVHELTSPD